MNMPKEHIVKHINQIIIYSVFSIQFLDVLQFFSKPRWMSETKNLTKLLIFIMQVRIGLNKKTSLYYTNTNKYTVSGLLQEIK